MVAREDEGGVLAAGVIGLDGLEDGCGGVLGGGIVSSSLSLLDVSVGGVGDALSAGDGVGVDHANCFVYLFYVI